MMFKAVWILMSLLWRISDTMPVMRTPGPNETVVCPNVEVHAAVEVNQTGWSVGATATFSCHPNHWYTGTNPRICQKEGTWSGVEGQCQSQACESLPKPYHGRLVPGSLPNGHQRMLLHCDKGYTNNGSQELVCDGDVWRGAPVKCIELARIKCQEPEIHKDVRIDYEKYANETAIHLSCKPGYHFFGKEKFTCQDNGTWTDSLAFCMARKCEQLPVVQHGGMFSIVGSSEDKVLIMCDTGYRLRGQKEISCHENGTWSTPGECQEIRCLQKPMIEHGKVHLNGYLYKATGTLRCNSGSWLKGSSTMTCQETGEWSPAGHCVRVRCSKKPTLHYGTVEAKGYMYGDTGTLICNSGFELLGSSTIRCQATGEWSLAGHCVREETNYTAIICGSILGIAAVLSVSSMAYLIWKNKQEERRNDPLQLLNEANRATFKKLRINPDRLTIGALLGEGYHGQVFSGTLRKKRSTDVERVALKSLRGGQPPSAEVLNEFIHEATIMQGFDHPNVLKIIGIAMVGDKFYVILPFMANGDLKNYLEKHAFNQELYIKFLHDAARGMEYLSSNNFVHRDIAARNCMIDEKNNLYICDFGLSRDLHSKDYYTPSDTTKRIPVKWMAPESLESHRYTTPSDVWSFGVLMWEVFSEGAKPFSHVPGADMLHHLLVGNRLRKPLKCPTVLYDLQVECWSADPRHRPTFTMLVSRIQHILRHINTLVTPPSSVSTSGAGATGGSLPGVHSTATPAATVVTASVHAAGPVMTTTHTTAPLPILMSTHVPAQAPASAPPPAPASAPAPAPAPAPAQATATATATATSATSPGMAPTSAAASVPKVSVPLLTPRRIKVPLLTGGLPQAADLTSRDKPKAVLAPGHPPALVPRSISTPRLTPALKPASSYIPRPARLRVPISLPAGAPVIDLSPLSAFKPPPVRQPVEASRFVPIPAPRSSLTLPSKPAPTSMPDASQAMDIESNQNIPETRQKEGMTPAEWVLLPVRTTRNNSSSDEEETVL